MLTFKIKNIEITMKEAEELYYELEKLFNKETAPMLPNYPYQYPTITPRPWEPIITCTANNHAWAVKGDY